jgi:hypothetical protein
MGGHFTSAAAPIWDLSTGQLANIAGGSAADAWSGDIDANGWRRFSHVYPAPVSGLVFTAPVIFMCDGISASLSYTGTSKSLYVAGPMVELMPNLAIVPDPRPGDYVATAASAIAVTPGRDRVRGQNYWAYSEAPASVATPLTGLSDSGVSETLGLPDSRGASNAIRLTEGTATSQHTLNCSVTVAGPTRYWRLSAKVKDVSRGYALLGAIASAGHIWIVNLATGVSSSAGGSIVATSVGTVDAYGYRDLSCVMQSLASATFGVGMSNNGTNNSYTGSSLSIDVHEIQLEYSFNPMAAGRGKYVRTSGKSIMGGSRILL